MTASRPGTLVLPACPPEHRERLTRAAVAWSEPVVIDTYEPETPSVFPMFFDNRVYQGSSGRVYPLPFVERVAEHKVPTSWQAVHLENAYLRVMVLPALGGRVHLAYDKAARYDMVYRQNVIKPALVGLAGPWVSGGIEFNWPQHHRPATYMPVDVSIEHADDGSVTVWCSDHDPLLRMKGMHGVCLRRDSSVLEVKVRLYNRTEQTQTFLWWANAAVRVNDSYQAFFPTDVDYVFDHAKRGVSSYPRATGTYYGIDYPARAALAPGADRLDWYRNIPVPTSYMAVGTRYDFFGGYDHDAGAGVVSWADHHIAPGKKLWTWGASEFGASWHRNLTDEDGPYVELMSGVYTANQPDFSFLQPGETKSFSQYWYPISAIGPVHQATRDVAVHLAADAGQIEVGVAATAPRPSMKIRVYDEEVEIGAWSVDVFPGSPFVVRLPASTSTSNQALRIEVAHDGRVLLNWRRGEVSEEPAPPAALEPRPPSDITSVEELFLTGTHLWQNRHATRSPEPYWRRALELDPGDARSHIALGSMYYSRGEYETARTHALAAVQRLTLHNLNPSDGSAHYLLGLAASRCGLLSEAYEAFSKAAWNTQWVAPARFMAAQLDCRAQRWTMALENLDIALQGDPHHLQCRDLRALVLLELDRGEDATDLLAATLAIDPLDWWAVHASGSALNCDSATCMDVAANYADSGFYSRALAVLDRAAAVAQTERYNGTAALISYRRKAILAQIGIAGGDDDLPPTRFCFPWLLDDHDALVARLRISPTDARAGNLMATWLYAHGRHTEALELWSAIAERGSEDPLVWRALALGAYNVQGDIAAAVVYLGKAVALAPGEGRLLYERDQLAQRSGQPPEERLLILQGHLSTVITRDDLSLELIELLTDTGAPRDALQLLRSRRFQPWEGGEGSVIAAWERTLLALADESMTDGASKTAIRLVEEAMSPPESLGEVRHPLKSSALLWLTLGDALARGGREDSARQAWQEASSAIGDFRDMAVDRFGEATLFSVVACRRLGLDERADTLVAGMEEAATRLAATVAHIDYFATSLPRLLLFAENPHEARQQRVAVLQAEVQWCRGESAAVIDRLDHLLAIDPNARSIRDLRRWLALADKTTSSLVRTP